MSLAQVVRSVSVTTEWARYGKNPGDHEGYRVLACSDGAVSFGSFREAIGRYDLGTPDELPQVATSYLAPVGQPDRSYLALAIAEYNEGHKDATGRPIAYTRYFCVPYRDLAAEGIGYLGLYQAFQAIGLPRSAGAPLLAQVPALPLPALAAGNLAVRVAALMLTNRNVCVLGAGQVSMAERLRFIDGVMSLLPYGMRAKMSAATWTRSSSQHRFRLFFSDNPRAALDGREADLVAIWDRPDQTPVPQEHAYAREYLHWLQAAMRSPADMLAGFTEETGFGSASVLRMLEKVGVNVPGREPRAAPPGQSPAPPGPPRNDHVTRILLAINDRVNTGNLRGLKADVAMLSSLVTRGEQNSGPPPDSARKQYRDVIFSHQLLRPELQAQLGKEAEPYNRALLRLAFGLPLSYQGYCELENVLGTGSPPVPGPPAVLLDAIRRAEMPDPRVAAIVLSYLGESRQKEWFRAANVSLGELVLRIAEPWDRDHHARTVCDALCWYLRTVPGRCVPAEARAALAPHDYLAPVLQDRYGDDALYQVGVLTTLISAAFGAKGLGKGPVIEILRKGSHAPSWALLAAVLSLLDPADPDLGALARESFFIGGLLKSGFGKDLEGRLLRHVSPEVAAVHAAPDPGATQPMDAPPRAPGRVRAALPSGRGGTPARPAAPEPTFEPAPPGPQQQQQQQQQEEEARKTWGGLLGGGFRRE